jgi:alkanesulfonate monooxygenase SsuD/methylene tetrahydromethanopterin reductase-like flavin-dependent oxidoreductase (luciferase family)
VTGTALQQSVGSIRRCITAFGGAGGDVARVPIGRFPVAGETDETARQAAWPAAERLTAGYRRGGDQLRRGILTEGEHDTERWLNEVAIVGSPETVSERVAAMRSSVSGASSWSRAFSATSRKNMVLRTLELFAQEVRPRLEPGTSRVS